MAEQLIESTGRRNCVYVDAIACLPDLARMSADWLKSRDVQDVPDVPVLTNQIAGNLSLKLRLRRLN